MEALRQLDQIRLDLLARVDPALELGHAIVAVEFNRVAAVAAVASEA
jgi:hypothetical protein